ncbi:MAG: hypothetical protein J1E34_09505 [Oscillospiraceae bacterium]|nr:hypothetical protein [Oscillospiraceae bacterium]
MFGYAVANPDKLDDESKERYRAMYCGICRALGENRKRLNRLTLTYDLVLVALVLSSVAKMPFSEESVRCGVHPVKEHKAFKNDYTLFAADMNILLAYYKFLDDKKDDGGIIPLIEVSFFKTEAEKLQKKYPLLSEKIEGCLNAISECEIRNETDADIPASFFGDLLGSIFAGARSPYPEKLYDFGFSLGKVIYYMDAEVDIKADLKKQRYNPLIRKSAQERQELLELQLGDCMFKYSLLPMGADKSITDNILLSGIWTAFERMKREEERG